MSAWEIQKTNRDPTDIRPVTFCKINCYPAVIKVLGNMEIPSGNSPVEPIAVVGMACRFPGQATNTEKFWDLLSRGHDTWSKFPKARFNQQAFWNADSAHHGTVYYTKTERQCIKLTAFVVSHAGWPFSHGRDIPIRYPILQHYSG